MARSKFVTGSDYYGQLYRVQSRPIENRDRNVSLIRLEFEVFERLAGDELKSTVKLACRDLVICPTAQSDPGVRLYGDALDVKQLTQLGEWTKAQGRWVKFTFSAPQEPDYRNPIATIDHVGVRGLHISTTAFETRDDWVSPAVAARRTHLGENTIRRRANKHAQEGFENMVRYKQVGKRRDMSVNLALLKVLEKD